MSDPSVQTSRSSLPFWRRLRWNLVFYFVVIAVLPVGLVTLITSPRHTEQDQKQVFNQLKSVAELKIDQLERLLQEGGTALKMIAADPISSALFVDALNQANTDKITDANQKLQYLSEA